MNLFTHQRRALFLSAITTVFVLLCCVCSDKSVEQAWDCGPESNPSSVKATLKKGTLTISGRGPMTDYTYKDGVSTAPWYGNSLLITKVVIGKGIEYIGKSAFYDYPNLTSVSIGNTVTEIGKDAFDKCVSLKSVTIPSSVTSVGVDKNKVADDDDDREADTFEDAFDGCTTLRSINVDPSNAKYSSVDGVVFSKDKTTLILCPEGKTGAYTIPNGVTQIESFAFETCTGLKSVIIPNGVTSIGHNAFFECTGLTSVNIPKSVTSIKYAFAMCTNLKYVTVDPDNIEYSSIDGVLFSKDKATLILCPEGRMEAYTIPDGVKIIAGFAFVRCTSLTSIIISNSVTTIEFGWVSECTKLSSINVNPDNAYYTSFDGVLFNKDKTTLILYPKGKTGAYTIPSSVTSIEPDCFVGCTKLTAVSICKSVTSIASFAFAGCTSLTSITILSLIPPKLDMYMVNGELETGKSIFEGVPKTACLYVPETSIRSYKSRYPWNTFTCLRPAT